MTPEEAIARIRARWAHAPLDVRDVEERVALRLVDRAAAPEVSALASNVAVRLFVTTGTDSAGRRRQVSRYVHTTTEVDAALDHLLEATG